MAGGAPYAGGRGTATPFGTIYAPNLTPDAETGLGRWSRDDFWRALHNGRSKDGRLLYPAFPYPSYSRVRREDADALYAWLRTLPPVYQPNRPHELGFPYRLQVSLAVWRALYFRPEVQRDDPARSATWNRGAYLVRGLGHCGTCHAERNALGAVSTGRELGGGLMPSGRWYAPSLLAAQEGGVAHWSEEDLMALLGGGSSAAGSAQGPMAEVVLGSTQYLDNADLQAMASFLRTLPQQPAPAGEALAPLAPQRLERGARLYARHCADCHGERGEGGGSEGKMLVPPLAGRRIVSMEPPVNLLRVILGGGFAPATQRQPRPFGMPPFVQLLSDEEVADLASYLRRSWGHQASAVGALQVNQLRAGIGSE